MADTKTKAPKESFEDTVLKEVSPAVRAVLLERVMLATPGLDPNGFTLPVDAPKDPKVLAIEKAIRDNQFNHSSDNDVLATILSTVLDMKLEPYPKSKSSFTQPFMLVVPLNNTNSHDYAVGGVCMLRSKGCKDAVEVVRGKVRVGNDLPTSKLGDGVELRFASKAEAEEFVTKVVSSLENIQKVRGWVPELDAYLDKM
ncbi:Uncharacterised protein [uncultured archaeon]|nr:Uncharacterised protein [uncultured archaeon]